MCWELTGLAAQSLWACNEQGQEPKDTGVLHSFQPAWQTRVSAPDLQLCSPCSLPGACLWLLLMTGPGARWPCGTVCDSCEVFGGKGTFVTVTGSRNRAVASASQCSVLQEPLIPSTALGHLLHPEQVQALHSCSTRRSPKVRATSPSTCKRSPGTAWELSPLSHLQQRAPAGCCR